MKKLNRIEKTIIYVIKSLNELEDAGLLEGRAFDVPENKNLEKQMEGFEPTPEEMFSVINFLKKEGHLQIEG
jgi:hypothetical protein